jgi:hypothetical protein
LPSARLKSDGQPRHVGVEIELQGIPVAELAELTAATLGGSVHAVSGAEYEVRVPAQGVYRVEVDFALLTHLGRMLQDGEGHDAESLEGMAMDALTSASSLLVPCEIVAPPIPMEDLAAPMDDLVAAVRSAGGRGTRHSPLYAFGVHLNVEPPVMRADVVAAYLKAFVCLADWIIWDGGVDLTRRMTPFIDRYPAEYDRLVADPAYRPDWPGLIDDYLDHNPTRNRALDMLPLFDHVDSDRVRARVDDDLIKGRPAFHYRLGNCCVDEPDWSVADPWHYWLQIEHLAGDADRLADCCRAFLADRERVFSSIDRRWREEVCQWLTD